MNPPTSTDDNPYGSIESVGDGETKVTEIHKHPFGIIILYIQTIVGLSIALGLMYLLLPQFVTEENSSLLHTILGTITLLAVGITLLVLFLASIIYQRSYMIITDKNVTQVLQKGLFTRQVSELSMANIEDVSSFQHGVFSTVLNYGKMVIETAGEQNNFIFSYCPKPNYHCKILLDARQRYVESDPSQAMRENARLNMPPTSTEASPPTPASDDSTSYS